MLRLIIFAEHLSAVTVESCSVMTCSLIGLLIEMQTLDVSLCFGGHQARVLACHGQWQMCCASGPSQPSKFLALSRWQYPKLRHRSGQHPSTEWLDGQCSTNPSPPLGNAYRMRLYKVQRSSYIVGWLCTLSRLVTGLMLVDRCRQVGQLQKRVRKSWWWKQCSNKEKFEWPFWI